ncbi:hypothetical protein [Morganella morganii]|uniref:hypothetical protein n=1 Tax=Morganella morganii TaxID=582 RepID=UPI001BD91DA0|nr:hypothetical protein [Morganella morganii]MBT0306501.1 hypothetical protein [Morganella morganii subsp. morganii]
MGYEPGGDILRSARVIKAYKDTLKRDSGIKIVDGLNDGECTGETIKQYNRKPEYYTSCVKSIILGVSDITFSEE